MAFASIAAQLENRTKYNLVRAAYELEDNAETAVPHAIGANQSTSWKSSSPIALYGGTGIYMQFSISDPDDGHFVGYVNTWCDIPLFSDNDYRMSITGTNVDVTEHNGGMNTSVRFVLEGTEGAFAAKIFPEGSTELGTVNDGGFQSVEPTAVSAVSRSKGRLDVFTAFGGGIFAGAWKPGDESFRAWWPVGNNILVATGSPVTALSRSTDLLDVFTTTGEGTVWTAAWMPGDEAFRGWWQIGSGGIARVREEVAAVSCTTDAMDIFVIGSDGGVWSSWWVPGQDGFSEWARIGDLQTAHGSRVAAVSRNDNKIDVFAIGVDGRVYTAAWQEGQEWYEGWWPIGDFRARPNAGVSAVSRTTDHLDLFVVGDDGLVYTAAWQPDDTAWRGWWPIGSLSAGFAADVYAISAFENWLDIFIVGDDGGVYTSFWAPGSDWQPWAPVAGGVAATGSPVIPVSRSPQKFDLFIIGPNQAVWTAAWEPGDPDWRGWWRIGG